MAAFEGFGQKPAIIWRDQRFTYARLAELTQRWAAEFGARPDTAPGTVVALTADYSPTSLALFLALVNSGQIVALTAPGVVGQKAERLQLAQVQTEIVVGSDDNVVFRDIGHRVSHPLLAGLAAAGTGGLVLFTSGSAGKPKAVVHDAERLLARVGTAVRARVTIPFMLFDHIGGINTVLQTLAAGGTAVIAGERKPIPICSLIEKHEVQVLPTTPTFLNLLLLSEFRKYNLSSLDIIAYGAERMPATLLKRLAIAFPGVKFIQNYGLSEAGILRTSSEANGSLWMTIGDRGVQTRVVDGKLELKSDTAMLGYLNEVSPFTEDGWLKTGDRVDLQGKYLQILGRDSEVINVGGEKVYPSEVEDLLTSMPHVVEALVSSQPNAITGQLVQAEVWLSSDETRQNFRRRMIDFMSDKVPGYKIPQRVTLRAQSFQGGRLKRRRSTEPAYERPVSAVDRGFLAHDALQPPTVIQLVLEGDGNATPAALRAALERTADANPGSCLVLDETGSVLTWRIGPPPPLTVVEAPEFAALDDGDAGLLQLPLNARQGPTCGLMLLRGNTKTYLIFSALHAVMDGQGVLRWAQDFARCLRGEEPLGHRSTITLDGLLRELAAPRRPILQKDALHPFGPANPKAGTGPFRWKRLKIARPFDARASGRIGVALAHRARASGAEGTVRLSLPADLRRYRPGERTTANFFGGLSIEVPLGANANDVSLRVVQALYQQEAIKPMGLYATDTVASLAAMQVQIFFGLARVDDTGRYHSSATLSNLGLLRSVDLSAPGFHVASAFFIPLESDSGCTITLNGYDRHTEAVVGLSDRFAGGGRLEEFADLVRVAIEHSTEAEPATIDRRSALPSVSETAILTLRARAAEHERSDRLFADPVAADWFARVEWPSRLDRWWSLTDGGRGIAFRADAIDHLVTQYQSIVPSLSVIELGCGLSTRRHRLSNLSFADWTDVDLPEMVQLRRSLGATGAHVAASVLDFSWMDQLNGDSYQHLFVAEGLLYYLQRAEVAALFQELRRRFPGAAIVFDVVGVNDYSALLEHTASAGAPITWYLEGNYSDALTTLGLGAIGELDPDRVAQDALGRYWHRLTPAQQVASYFAMNSAELRGGRSGVVLGKLG